MWWLPSNMGRSALIASFTINNEAVLTPRPALHSLLDPYARVTLTQERTCEQVSIGTVHLESLDQAPYREKQLEIIAGSVVVPWSPPSAWTMLCDVPLRHGTAHMQAL
jgi:hypothetical protein